MRIKSSKLCSMSWSIKMEGKVYTFCLPDIGEGVVEGEVVEWLKKVGDRVAQDEPVVVVMTDKATVELPAPYPGEIKKQYYKPGETAIKDKPLYDILLDEGQVVSTETKPKEVEAISKPVFGQGQGQGQGQGVKAIPKVRHEAKEWNIDIDQLTGTGADGRITEEDLHHALAEKKEMPVPKHLEGDDEQSLVGVRGLMAKKMDETHIPQFSYFEQADAVHLVQLRQKMQDKAGEEGIKLSFMPFFIRALSLTIKQFPQLNASMDIQGGKVLLHKQHNIGIAMASPQGLIVPVLKGVQTMTLNELIRAYEAMKSKVGKLTPDDMKDGTITISNFGVLGGEGMWATPMIMEPEVAILAVAKIRKASVVKGEQAVIRDIVPLSWSFDHRLIDGELAAKISHFYCELIKNPASLL
jgi:pyruvate dehydrogenase E2 component (dihydrolipoamide acetyltransferase)